MSTVGPILQGLDVSAIRLYCINLPKSKDRRRAMQHVFNSLVPLRTHFVRAYSPMDTEFKKLKKSRHVDKKYNPRCYCVVKHNGRCTKHRVRALRDVEIAISMSHHHAYKKILRNKDKLAIVCEDDVIVLPNLVQILGRLFRNDSTLRNKLFSNHPTILFFGGGSNNPGLIKDRPDQFSVRDNPNGVYSNYCYLLNAAGARLLDKRMYPIIRPEDSYKRHLIGMGVLTSYQIVPSVVAELSAGVNAQAIYSRLSKPATRKAFENSVNRTPGQRAVNSDLIGRIVRPSVHSTAHTKPHSTHTKPHSAYSARIKQHNTPRHHNNSQIITFRDNAQVRAKIVPRVVMGNEILHSIGPKTKKTIRSEPKSKHTTPKHKKAKARQRHLKKRMIAGTGKIRIGSR